ncbi:MAG: hypothetical protein IKE75_06325 [Bacilli bacterium]|nr:hypothetical protein [Bacilli bacterium]
MFQKTKNIVNTLFKLVVDHKLISFCFVLFYLILVYCHFQTFIINDDLPYSLYFRVNDRITDLKGVIINQIFDYSHISPRVFIHTMVQLLLIFNKDLWSILNPLVICIIIGLMGYILFMITGKKVKPLYLVLSCMVGFLLLYNYKYLVYWVAGSVNYVWVFLVILLFMLYYIKGGFERPILTFIICLCTSILCEALSVFVIVIVIYDLFLKLFVEKEDKKIILRYLLYLFGAILGFLFLMLAPSNIGRMVGTDDWSSLGFINKLLISIPVLSIYNFNGFDFYNLFPLFWFISIIYYVFARKCKFKKTFVILSLLVFLSGVILNNGWCFFIFGILLLIYQIYIFILNKDYNLIGILLGGYAVLFSLAITPEYYASRTGFHLALIMFMFMVYNLIYDRDFNKLVKIIIILLVVVTVVFEIVIYSYIGVIKNERMASLNNVIAGKSDTVEVEIIKKPFDKFHIDANSPIDKEYWAYAAYEDYYNFPNDIKFKVLK